MVSINHSQKLKTKQILTFFAAPCCIEKRGGVARAAGQKSVGGIRYLQSQVSEMTARELLKL